MKQIFQKIVLGVALLSMANASFAWSYRQGCWTVYDRQEMYIPDGESKSWGNAFDLSLLGVAGGLSSLAAVIGAQVISIGRDAVNANTAPSQKPNAVALSFESDFGEKFTFLFQGRAYPIGEDVKLGEHGYVKVAYYANSKQADIPYFSKVDSPKLVDKSNPSMDYLDACYEKTPNGYTSLANIPDRPNRLKHVPVPEFAMKKFIERDGPSAQPAQAAQPTAPVVTTQASN